MKNSHLQETINLQRIASNPLNSAWVFASAGSGKTKILTDRVLRLLLSDVAPSKILCLTFTKNAAAEMQERINKALASWVLCNEDELKVELEKLTGQIPSKNEIKKAQILFNKILDEEFKIKAQTIHSFCQNLIKIFPFEAKIKPNFEIIETTKETLLLKQAQQKLLEDGLFNQELRFLITRISSRIDEESFLKLVGNLLQKKEKLNLLNENFFGIENVADEIYKKLSVSKQDSEIEIIKKFINEEKIKEAEILAIELEKTQLKSNLTIEKAIKEFYKNPSLRSFSNYREAFFTEKNEPRKLSKKTLENQVIKNLSQNQQNFIISLSDKLNSLIIAKDSESLLKFVNKIIENYSILKIQNSFLDYNDLIAQTNKLLANPDFSQWIQLKMDGNFDHILIDESQDTNHQQWNIIKCLTDDFFSGLSASEKNRSIFIVGDEKQSIYSFQGSEINISEEIFEYFFRKTNQTLKKISLNNSFRSVSTVLKAVDAIFSDEKIKKSISKISEFENHLPIRQGEGVLEIWPQIKHEKLKEKDESFLWDVSFENKEKYDEKDELAEIIASKIKFWVQNKKILKAKNREVKYGDFMILLRARTNGFNESLIKFFNQYQIPFSNSGRVNFSDNLLLQDLLSVAKFSLLQEDDLNLAALLKSPIFNVGEEDLFEISMLKNSEKISLFKALGKIDKFKNIKENLDKIIKKSLELSAFEFFYFVLEFENNRQKLTSYFGLEGLQIIDKFLMLVSDFCDNFSNNLQNFIDFIEKIDPEISLNSNEDNLVKISTVHAAKGLQAPIVILPDCCYNINKLESTKDRIIWIDNLPIYLAKKSYENSLVKFHKAAKLKEIKDEYLRLFYVATTRAEDELYIGGFGSSKDPESWYEIAKNALPSSVIDDIKIEETCQENSDKTIEKPLKINFNKENYFKVERKLDSEKTQINHSQIRGKLIHKIFEIFGKNHSQEKSWLLNLAKNIIEKENLLLEDKKIEIFGEISAFLESNLFDEIFNGEIQCETEISTKINGENSIVRIDFFRIKGDEILIIDYKSDETLPKITPEEYIKQLQIYKNSIKKIFPNKKISCAILWTKFLKIDYIE